MIIDGDILRLNNGKRIDLSKMPSDVVEAITEMYDAMTDMQISMAAQHRRFRDRLKAVPLN